MDSLEIRHKLEKQLEKALRKARPDHPALKRIYFSTDEAIKAYIKALDRIK